MLLLFGQIFFIIVKYQAYQSQQVLGHKYQANLEKFLNFKWYGRIYAHIKRPIAHMRRNYSHMRGNSTLTRTIWNLHIFGGFSSCYIRVFIFYFYNGHFWIWSFLVCWCIIRNHVFFCFFFPLNFSNKLAGI